MSLFKRLLRNKTMIVLALGSGLMVACSNNDDDGDTTGNTAPEITSLTASTSNAQFGENVTITCLASDADGDDLSYSWTLDGVDHAATTAQFAWTAPDTAGNYTFAVTVSDGVTTDSDNVLVGVAMDPTPQLEIVSGTILDDMTMTADRAWLLRGGVFIGDGTNETVLTIEPGTIIYGESTTDGMLVVRRGSRLMADGTAEAPIVFTSDKLDGERGRSDWGGLILNGYAPLNSGDDNGEASGEGGTGTYGGTDAADNSGVLRYVRVEFAGREISPDNELNGISFQGVGSGTTVDFVQVHMCKDDGMEFYGGTVNIKHCLITGAADDSFDWTDGWRGKGQFMAVMQYGDDADQGIEADNSGEDNDASPRSMPELYNLTLVGDDRLGTDESDIGILLREGTGAKIHNAIVLNFGDAGIDIDHEATFLNATDDNGASLNGNLVVDYSIFHDSHDTWQTGEDDETVFSTQNFVETLNTHNAIADPMLSDAYNYGAPDFTPAAGSPAIGNGMSPPADGFFDSVDYIGAFAVGDNWINGWTNFARN